MGSAVLGEEGDVVLSEDAGRAILYAATFARGGEGLSEADAATLTKQFHRALMVATACKLVLSGRLLVDFRDGNVLFRGIPEGQEKEYLAGRARILTAEE